MDNSISSDSAQSTSKLWWIAILALLLLQFYRAPLLESLWLDETITSWLTAGSYSDLWSRTVHYQGQSPLYFSMIWIIRQIFGGSELVLRLPSVLCIVFAAYEVWKLCEQMFGVRAAIFSVILFLSHDDVLIAAVSARPYAAALLGSILSARLFISFLQKPTKRILFIYLLSILLTFYLHYLFAGILLIHLGILLLDKNNKDKIKPITFCWTVFIILSLPGLLQLLHLSQRGVALSFVSSPSIRSILLGFTPAPTALFIVIAGAIAALNGNLIKDRLDFTKVKWLLFWFVLPPTIFLIISTIGSSYWVSRYWLWQVPATAILGALLLSKFKTGILVDLSLIVLMFLVVFRESGRLWVIEDFRGASNYIDDTKPTGPVFFYSGLIEAAKVDDSLSLQDLDYLTAPFKVYPIPNHVVILPAMLSGVNLNYVVKRIEPPFSAEKEMTVVLKINQARGENRDPIGQMREILHRGGWNQVDDRRFGSVEVVRFRR